MRKLLPFLFAIFLLNICIKGQSHYRAGFIITKNNDTLTGLIDYEGEIRNAKSCF
jgi:hypothetical protein